MLFTRENEDKKIVWKGVKEEVENSELETPVVEEEVVDEKMEIELPPEELEDLNPEENEGL
jgi:hypothetical protein